MAGAIGDIEQQRLLDIQNTIYNPTTGTNQILQLQGYLDTIDSDIVNSSAAASSLAYQSETKTILQDEYARLNLKQASVDDAYAGTKRMVQLNQNYQKRYWDYTKIVMAWVFILIAFVAFKLIEVYVPIVPPVLFDVLMIIFVVVGIIYSVSIYLTLRSYDLANYGKLQSQSPSQATAAPTLGAGQTADSSRGGSNYLQSSYDGQQYCAPGTKWSHLSGLCRPDPGANYGWDVTVKKNITSTNCVSGKITTAETGAINGVAPNSVVGDTCETFVSANGPSETTDYAFI